MASTEDGGIKFLPWYSDSCDQFRFLRSAAFFVKSEAELTPRKCLWGVTRQYGGGKERLWWVVDSITQNAFSGPGRAHSLSKTKSESDEVSSGCVVKARGWTQEGQTGWCPGVSIPFSSRVCSGGPELEYLLSRIPPGAVVNGGDHTP